jgi:hypothetical protein
MTVTTSIVTPALVNALRNQTSLPKESWYFIAGVTLSTLNRPDDVGKIFQAAVEGPKAQGQAEQLLIVRKMREALVKSAAIGGLPKVDSAYARRFL